MKSLPAVQETNEMKVHPLNHEVSLEKEILQPSPLSLPENPKDRGGWWTTIHGVTKESDSTEWLNMEMHIFILINVHSYEFISNK